MRRGRRWTLIASVILIAVAPLFLFPGGWRTLALVILPLIWLGNRIATGHFIPATPYDVVLLVLLVMVLISLYATYDVAVSLPKITGVLFGVGLMYSMVGFATTWKRLRWTTLGLLMAIVIFTAFVLIGTAWGHKVPVLQQIGVALPALVRGLPGAADGFHPAEVAGTLTWIVFLPIVALMAMWSSWSKPRKVFAAFMLITLLAALVLALVLAQSRSGWIGAAAGSVASLLLVSRRSRVFLAVGAVAVVAGFIVLRPSAVVEGSLGNPPPELEAVFTPNLDSRLEIWSRAIYGIQDFPLTGMGLGTFRYVVPVLYPLFLVPPEVDIAHAHNEVLQAGLDLGIPGLIAFSALQALAIFLAYTMFRSDAPAFTRWMALGALAGLVAHAVFGLTDTVALGAKPGVFFWALLGLVAAMWNLAAAPRAVSEHD